MVLWKARLREKKVFRCLQKSLSGTMGHRPNFSNDSRDCCHANSVEDAVMHVVYSAGETGRKTGGADDRWTPHQTAFVTASD